MIKKGETICILEGAYSDYGPIGLFVAAEDFEPDLLISEYKKNNLVKLWSGDRFVNWLLIKKKIIKELDNATEWHLNFR